MGSGVQGELDEATKALRAALDQVAALTAALNRVAGVARDGLGAWEKYGTPPVAELSSIGQLARDVVWSSGGSGAGVVDDGRVEAVARVIHEAERAWSSSLGVSWGECRDSTREMRRVCARAVLGVLGEEGSGG